MKPLPTPKNPTVSAYLAALDTPLLSLFLDVRATVLKAAPSFTEDIKWKNCLTYAAKKNAIQTVLGKAQVSLIFFEGKQLKDPKRLLEGDGAKTRTVRITPENFDRDALAALVVQAVKLAA